MRQPGRLAVPADGVAVRPYAHPPRSHCHRARLVWLHPVAHSFVPVDAAEDPIKAGVAPELVLLGLTSARCGSCNAPVGFDGKPL